MDKYKLLNNITNNWRRKRETCFWRLKTNLRNVDILYTPDNLNNLENIYKNIISR